MTPAVTPAPTGDTMVTTMYGAGVSLAALLAVKSTKCVCSERSISSTPLPAPLGPLFIAVSYARADVVTLPYESPSPSSATTGPAIGASTCSAAPTRRSGGRFLRSQDTQAAPTHQQPAPVPAGASECFSRQRLSPATFFPQLLHPGFSDFCTLPVLNLHCDQLLRQQTCSSIPLRYCWSLSLFTSSAALFSESDIVLACPAPH
ncbi:hypothetical protein O3P69_010024 [Scylla paramamosain]|uniref:Uncharacterized protein n=1 Tax=Scylla paramamosain TaxID=85552 RepID=A0AAW0SP98_SCYPA